MPGGISIWIAERLEDVAHASGRRLSYDHNAVEAELNGIRTVRELARWVQALPQLADEDEPERRTHALDPLMQRCAPTDGSVRPRAPRYDALTAATPHARLLAPTRMDAATVRCTAEPALPRWFRSAAARALHHGSTLQAP
jgi:hypothetical protein